uniref:Uncharacterized protein n=1 Tax=Meloidogyne incognita TaxID=6306 RepID=A0A914KU27_MELIC
MPKECPDTPQIGHYIHINTSKYEIDTKLYQDRHEIECKAQPYCPQAHCECDR